MILLTLFLAAVKPQTESIIDESINQAGALIQKYYKDVYKLLGQDSKTLNLFIITSCQRNILYTNFIPYLSFFSTSFYQNFIYDSTAESYKNSFKLIKLLTDLTQVVLNLSSLHEDRMEKLIAKNLERLNPMLKQYQQRIYKNSIKLFERLKDLDTSANSVSTSINSFRGFYENEIKKTQQQLSLMANEYVECDDELNIEEKINSSIRNYLHRHLRCDEPS